MFKIVIMFHSFRNKKICILSDCFIPVKNSGAGMLYNLLMELDKEKCKLIFVYGGLNPYHKPEIFNEYKMPKINFISSNLLNNFRNNSLVKRFIFEIFLSISLSFKVLYNKKSFKNIDLIIWYGPSAFLWIPALIIQIISKSKVLYILRDIFPEWINSIGLLKKRIIYYILKFLTYPQYLIPNYIGVESRKSIDLVKRIAPKNKIIELIYNWPSLNQNFNRKNRVNSYLKSQKIQNKKK